MELRPQTNTTANLCEKVDFSWETFWKSYRFSKDMPIIVTDIWPDNPDVGECDELDEYDHESRIQSSWYHRALLFDEHRVIYDDFQDTDFDIVQCRDEDSEDSDVE